MKTKRHWLFKTIYLIAIGLVLIMKLSCRKFDSIDKTHLDNAALTEKFFNAHKSDNPLTQQIAAYFLRQNSKTGIASKIASNYGIAYWDKTLLFQSGNKQNGRSSSDSSSLVAYIPLLSNTDTTVNAQLTVKLTTTDTVFEVLTSHEYAKFGFLPTDSSKLNGLKIFTLFANHDKNIFGYKKFKILDNRILQGQTNFTVNMNKNYIVELDTTTSSVSGRTFMLASPTPIPHSSCLIVKDYENAGYWVNYTTVGGVCIISSYGLNGDFTGDNGGGGGGGGGSIEPPSWEPIVPIEIIPDPNILGNFFDDPNVFEDDPTQITFEYDIDPWQTIGNVLSPSQFVPYDHRNCLTLAIAQISKAGLRDLGYGSAFKVYDANGGPYPNIAKSGVNYIITKLQSGKPVIVGVDNRPGTPSSTNADGKTDHFVTIVGSGIDANGKYFTFFDNATNLESKGCNIYNKLYYNENTGIISGYSAANGTPPTYHDYIVTQIRKNQ